MELRVREFGFTDVEGFTDDPFPRVLVFSEEHKEVSHMTELNSNDRGGLHISKR